MKTIKLNNMVISKAEAAFINDTYTLTEIQSLDSLDNLQGFSSC